MIGRRNLSTFLVGRQSSPATSGRRPGRPRDELAWRSQRESRLRLSAWDQKPDWLREKWHLLPFRVEKIEYSVDNAPDPLTSPFYYLFFFVNYCFLVILFSTPPGVPENKKSPSHFSRDFGTQSVHRV